MDPGLCRDDLSEERRFTCRRVWRMLSRKFHTGNAMRTQRLTMIIFIGMVLGILVGYACNKLWPDPQTAKAIAG